MHTRNRTLLFVGTAALVGVGFGLLSRYSEAIVVKLSITLPLIAASQVDSSYIVKESWQGNVAFWLTIILQWIVIGRLAAFVWALFGAKKRSE
jgi:hypothetical protein